MSVQFDLICYGNGYALLRPEPTEEPEPDRDATLTLALLGVRGMVLAGMDVLDICDRIDRALALLRGKQP